MFVWARPTDEPTDGCLLAGEEVEGGGRDDEALAELSNGGAARSEKHCSRLADGGNDERRR
jgi:hypothetical protein